jgi:hypothetical protein
MKMGEPDQNFLSRWSRRKAQVRQGGEPPAQEALPVSTAVAAELAPAPASGTAPLALPAAAPVGAEAQPEVPKPTLADVQALTQESDFSRFVGRDVDPEVKNLAMKKLFADPHYNVMDGLDTYIDDYNTPDPIPAAMFKQLVQARMLGLLDDELEDQVPAAGSAAAAQATDVPPVADADPDQVLAEGAAEPPDAEVAAATEALEPTPVVGGRAWESNPPGTA